MMYSSEEIATLLNVSPSTIETSKRSIREILSRYKWAWKTNPTDREILVQSRLADMLNRVPDWFDIPDPPQL